MTNIAIALSEFNNEVSEGLLSGCKKALLDKGVNGRNISVLRVPGAFELPAAAAKLAQYKDIDGVIALGAVIRGETDHYHYISQAVAQGLMQVTLHSTVPVMFGVLTCPTVELAIVRSEPQSRKNKGYEVGIATMEMLNQ
ncbi:MAG TPA: 6,7-dimethyl-8-ribityllumazine synthase [Anaerolineales bacterium]|nr:6,7-dimethyl-8-ribityllumazine synthase [Anaerolineaceae bacterium]HJO90712.1 6,7-dimethyl-8-ribityllumazine synthase [Anaerolineales bacterium]